MAYRSNYRDSFTVESVIKKDFKKCMQETACENERKLDTWAFYKDMYEPKYILSKIRLSGKMHL